MSFKCGNINFIFIIPYIYVWVYCMREEGKWLILKELMSLRKNAEKKA